MTEDDRKDIEDAIEALNDALDALLEAERGASIAQRERFVFKVGFARGRLSRVSSRIYAGPGEGEVR